MLALPSITKRSLSAFWPQVGPSRRPFISVIIPAWNEVQVIARTLSRIPQDSEAIVVDGGSTDGTPRAVRGCARHAIKLLVLPNRPRGTLLNAGAQKARGEVLLFLHADTRLPSNAATAIGQALHDPAVAGGAFSLSFVPRRFAYALVAFGANVRSRLFGLPYGDQALFVRRSVFRSLRGFKPWPLLEDVDLVLRLRRYGRLALLTATVQTSARRYQRLGLVRTVMGNLGLLTRYWVGEDPRRLARAYWRPSG